MAYKDVDSLEYARVLMNKGWASCLRGKAKEGLTEVEKALILFEEKYALTDLACALTQASAFGSSFNEFPAEKCLRMGLRAAAIYEDLKDFRGQVETYHFLSSTFLNYGLFEEARQIFDRAIKLGDEIADTNHLAWLYLYYSMMPEFHGNLDEAIVLSLRGVENAKKTETFYVHCMLYCNLIRYYSKTGNLTKSQECYERMMTMFPALERTGSKLAIASGKKSIALYFAAFDKFAEANKFAEESLEMTISLQHKFFEMMLRKDYSWILARQGKTEEAKIQLEIAEQLFSKLNKRFTQFDVEADLTIPKDVMTFQESFMRLDIVNLSRKESTIVSVSGLMPESITVTNIPSNLQFRDHSITLNEPRIEAFKTKSLKLKFQTSRSGIILLNPEITSTNEQGQLLSTKLRKTEISAKHADINKNALPGRVSTGYPDLDNILLGGIPEKYALALTASVSDEREQLIKQFLEAGAKDSGLTYYLTTDTTKAHKFAEEPRTNFYIFVCNPKAEQTAKDLPNVFRLKGVENLTDIDIALLKAFRMLSPKPTGPRRACIELVSDILLQHHAVITRKWLNSLLPDLKSNGFTTIAIIDPQMHPHEEVQAIMGLFDGELKAFEKETEKGVEKTLMVKRLRDQRYSENEISLKKDN
jgi:tetratricopeptide (TPR) repeat protein/KaiC/GvpD/RAD55 family RecA-like ATPase